MLIDKKRASELFDLYYKDIYHYCRVLTENLCDAEDSAQETFLALIKKADILDDENLKSWLYSTANFEVRKLKKKQSKDSMHIAFSYDAMDKNQIASSFSIEVEFDNLNYSDEVILKHKEKILSKLSAEDQDLYSRIYESNKSYREIAEELNISQKAVNVRAFRLRTKINNILKYSIGLISLILVFMKNL